MPTGVVTMLDMMVRKMSRGSAPKQYPPTNRVGRHGISDQFVPIRDAVLAVANGAEDTVFIFSTEKLGEEKAKYDVKRAFDAAKRYAKQLGLGNDQIDVYVSRSDRDYNLVISGK